MFTDVVQLSLSVKTIIYVISEVAQVLWGGFPRTERQCKKSR